MLREVIEYSHKIKEEVKAIKSEMKKNLQETNIEGKEARIQINNLEQREEINIQLEGEKKEFKKLRRGLTTSGTTLNVPISKS